MMLPMSAISSMDDEEFGEPIGEIYDAPDEEDVPVDFARQGIAARASDLMGGEMDADGVSADLIDGGSEMILWGLSPTPDAVAVAPDLRDWTDPRVWLESLEEFDFPSDIEAAIERAARAAVAQMERGAEGEVRNRFAARVADIMRAGGVETLAVRQERGFDWIVLDAQDLAREQDGQPWSPPGGFEDTEDLRDLGVSLGRGGRVRLWPTAPAAREAAPTPSQPRSEQRSPPPPPPPARGPAMS